jgi:hypothetical protein
VSCTLLTLMLLADSPLHRATSRRVKIFFIVKDISVGGSLFVR